MASAKLFSMTGADLGTVDLNDSVFGVEVNEGLVHTVAVALMNAKRQGNAETLNRALVRGGGKKPFKQKGTGNARRGSIREPHMRGGGVVFGPHKRSYRQSVSVAEKRKALCSVLSDRVADEALCVLDKLAFEAPKTKEFCSLMEKLSVDGMKTLFVTADANKNVMLSSRNIPRVAITTAADLNVLDVLNATRVVFAQDALPKLEERLQCN